MSDPPNAGENGGPRPESRAGMPAGAAANGGPAPPGPHAGPPAPLVLSVAAGGLGLVLLVAAAVLGSSALSVAGVVAGTASLGAALYWRSLLISAWAARKQSPRR